MAIPKIIQRFLFIGITLSLFFGYNFWEEMNKTGKQHNATVEGFFS